MSITVLYFASLREALGVEREELTLPAEVADVACLRAWLLTRGDPWAPLAAPRIRAAVNQVLASDTTADVVVVGSGIAGLSTAYELARRGSSVVVLDRGPIGRGMTARTTAHLSSQLDDFYSEMIPVRGEEGNPCCP